MTDEQKRMIPALRDAGHTYKEIADEVGVPVSTIKTFFRRNKTPVAPVVNKAKTETRHCLFCGREMEQVQGRKEKKFCSDGCRMKWWNSHPELQNRKGMTKCECAYCHKTFFAYGSAGRKYCSHECYIEDRFGGGHD